MRVKKAISPLIKLMRLHKQHYYPILYSATFLVNAPGLEHCVVMSDLWMFLNLEQPTMLRTSASRRRPTFKMQIEAKLFNSRNWPWKDGETMTVGMAI